MNIDRQNLIKALKYSVADNLPYKDYRKSFIDEFESLVRLHLATLMKRLKEIDKRIIDVFAKYGFESVAEQDRFSRDFENKVENVIGLWLSNDDYFLKRFKQLKKAYESKIKSKDMIADIEARLEDLYEEIDDHAKEANEYGSNWTNRMDNASLQVKNKVIRNTIKWFIHLTPQELIENYERAFKEKL